MYEIRADAAEGPGSFITLCVPQDAFLRQKIMFAVMPSTCTRKLEVETSQAHMMYYSRKTLDEAYEELNPWFDLETRCGQV